MVSICTIELEHDKKNVIPEEPNECGVSEFSAFFGKACFVIALFYKYFSIHLSYQFNVLQIVKCFLHTWNLIFGLGVIELCRNR